MPRLQGRIDPDGAVINVLIAIDGTEEEFFRSEGKPVPEPFSTTALIDTAASQTAVDPMILSYLGSVQRGFTPVAVPGQEDKFFPLYDVRISLGSHGLYFDTQVVGVLPATRTVAVLIGRDVLRHGTLLFDGANRTFSLWF